MTNIAAPDTYFTGTQHGIVYDFINFHQLIYHLSGRDPTIISAGCKGLRSNQLFKSSEPKTDGNNPLSYHCDGILDCLDGSDEGSRICRNYRTDANELNDGIKLSVSF